MYQVSLWRRDLEKEIYGSWQLVKVDFQNIFLTFDPLQFVISFSFFITKSFDFLPYPQLSVTAKKLPQHPPAINRFPLTNRRSRDSVGADSWAYKGLIGSAP